MHAALRFPSGTRHSVNELRPRACFVYKHYIHFSRAQTGGVSLTSRVLCTVQRGVCLHCRLRHRISITVWSDA